MISQNPHEKICLSGRTCSVVRRTKLLVQRYLLPLKMDHPGVMFATGDLCGPLDKYGSFNQ